MPQQKHAAGDTTHLVQISPEQCVFMAWIGLWCATLWYQAPEEQLFRLEQLFDALEKMRDHEWHLPLEMFQLIMQSCLNYGSPEMVIKIYKSLPTFNVRANGGVCSIYFNAVNLLQQVKQNKKAEPPKRLLSQMPSKLQEASDGFVKIVNDKKAEIAYYKEKAKFFKERTFCMREEQFIMGDKVQISVDGNQCSKCGIDLKYDEIEKYATASWTNEPFFELKCYKCTQPADLQMKIRIGQKFSDKNGQTFIEIPATLMIPQQLKEMIEKLVLQANNKVKIDVPQIRSFYKSIFWNAIWHFSRMRLPYDLFLPYKKDMRYEGIVQNVSTVNLTTGDMWEKEDKNELDMQKKYEEKIRKKLIFKEVGIQTMGVLPLKSKEFTQITEAKTNV